MCDGRITLGEGCRICAVTGESGSGKGLAGSVGGEAGKGAATVHPLPLMSFSVCGSTAGKPFIGGMFSSASDRRNGGKTSDDVLMSEVRRAFTPLLEL